MDLPGTGREYGILLVDDVRVFASRWVVLCGDAVSSFDVSSWVVIKVRGIVLWLTPPKHYSRLENNADEYLDV